MTAPILQARFLGMTFDNSNGRLQVLDNINFTVPQGEFLCVIGPSGCGKTTLLQILGGLLRGYSGHVLMSGKTLTEPHPDISMVFQKPNLMPWRTVLENVLLPLKINGVPYEESKKRARDMLLKVGLLDFASAYPKALSGGMEQRVAVARSLVIRPRILLLDEPFGALDALTRANLNLELLHLWRNQNITAIMVTHNIHEAVLLADRVLVLSPRPATVTTEIHIKLPRPRSEDIEYTKEFVDLTYKIRKSILQ
jgi:NitT/TauT family transport system ATP-binding protein